MSLFDRLFRVTRFRPDPERDAREEVRFHLEMRARELEEAGVEPDEARRRAEAAFGDVEGVEAEIRRRTRRRERRRMRRWTLAALARDVRIAGRTLARSPGFTLVALLTLALGIGANTAIFSVADAALLRPLPVEDPDGLVRVWTTCRAGDLRCSSSYPDYEDYRNGTSSLVDLAAWSWLPASVGGDGGRDAAVVAVQAVTGNYFSLLGLRAHRGRLLGPADDAPGAEVRQVVLAHQAWRNRFGADPGVVGSTLRLNGIPFTVVGVAPESFRGLTLTPVPEVFLSMRGAPLLGVGAVSEEGIFEARGSRWIEGLVGRLSDGATPARARAELEALAEGLNQAHPDTRGERTVTVDGADRIRLPAGDGGEISRFVGVLGGLVVLTLLLACANLANLLLARATVRRREVGVRRALGAGRSRLISQLMTEAGLLAALGGAAGLAVAALLLRLLGGFRIPGVPLDDLALALDGRALLFTAGIALLTALLFGVLPSLFLTREDPATALRAGGGSAREASGGWTRNLLVGVQVALGVLLLAGAGVLLDGLREALRIDLGVRTEGVAVARFNLSLLGYEPSEALRVGEDLVEAVLRSPDVTSATLTTRVPLLPGGGRGLFVEVPDHEPSDREELRAEYVVVTDGFFRTLGVPMRAGRSFVPADAGEGAPPVIVIDQRAARRWWPGGDAVGGRLRLAGLDFEVVGVARAVNWDGVEPEETPMLFLPAGRFPGQFGSSFTSLVARTEGEPGAVVAATRDFFAEREPGAALDESGSLEGLLEAVLAPQRMGALLFTAFGLLAALLAGVGVAGVVAYAVGRRRREIGVRMALGAKGTGILALVLGGVVPPLVWGAATGSVAAVLLSGAVRDLLPSASGGGAAGGAGVLLAATLLLVGVAGGAGLLPARAAVRLDPATVLREE